jgi:ornithine carbamoyltransferase
MVHFLDIDKVSKSVLRSMVDEAREIKERRKTQKSGVLDEKRFLEGCVVGLIFEKPSTRTRISFDVGIRQMGGQSMVLSTADLQLSNGENISDTSKVLSGYLDMLIIRTFDESLMVDLALSSSIPIINGLTNCSHPCQVMADILTFEEKRGCIEGRKVVWLGDGNNVCVSYIHAAAQFGFKLKVACPDEFKPDPEALTWANQFDNFVELITDPCEAIENADLVVTDTYTSMHDDKLSSKARIETLSRYQVTSELMSMAKNEAVFLHCLPAYRNVEVTSEVIDGPQSAVFEAAENRMHVQKAIMKWCISA